MEYKLVGQDYVNDLIWIISLNSHNFLSYGYYPYFRSQAKGAYDLAQIHTANSLEYLTIEPKQMYTVLYCPPVSPKI